MIPRPRPKLELHRACTPRRRCISQSRHYAAAAAAIAPAPSLEQTISPSIPIQRHAPTKPPSHKPPELRKSQLLRQYTSLLRSTPLILLFQHNNLRATEWTALRRELDLALRKVSAASSPPSPEDLDPADSIKFQVIKPSIFEVAVRIIEFYDPTLSSQQSDPTTPLPPAPASQEYTHSLSASAHAISHGPSPYAPLKSKLHALLSGPIALLTFPAVAPAHLAAALSILAPTPGARSAFPAPRRRDNPGYYEGSVQAGLQKLMLLGARAEGRVLDGGGVRGVGALPGLEGLRGEVVRLLGGVGAGVTGVLEGASRSLYVAMEGRRLDLEEKERSKESAGAEGK